MVILPLSPPGICTTHGALDSTHCQVCTYAKHKLSLCRPSSSTKAIVDSVDPRIPPPYNIAGSGHSRYNREAYDKIMGSGTHYVTVVR